MRRVEGWQSSHQSAVGRVQFQLRDNVVVCPSAERFFCAAANRRFLFRLQSWAGMVKSGFVESSMLLSGLFNHACQQPGISFCSAGFSAEGLPGVRLTHSLLQDLISAPDAFGLMMRQRTRQPTITPPTAPDMTGLALARDQKFFSAVGHRVKPVLPPTFGSPVPMRAAIDDGLEPVLNAQRKRHGYVPAVRAASSLHDLPMLLRPGIPFPSRKSSC